MTDLTLDRTVSEEEDRVVIDYVRPHSLPHQVILISYTVECGCVITVGNGAILSVSIQQQCLVIWQNGSIV